MPKLTRLRRTLSAAVLCLFAGASPLGSAELSGQVDVELRGFTQSPAHPRQSRHGASLALQPELRHTLHDDRHSLLFVPFLRLDSSDEERTHFDVRELIYQGLGDSMEWRIGVGRVFWGVAESYHLIDIINQSDLVDDADGENKLGQPLVNLTMIRDWGALDLFVLPFFRERTFPGVKGRLRSGIPVDADRAIYESGAGRNRVDYAFRWSHTFDAFDVGLAHFHGTARAPRLLPECIPPSCNPQTGEGFVLTPYYEVTRRTSLDLQVTGDVTLWKLEALYEARHEESWFGWVAGVEYTWYDVAETGFDVGFLLEHLFDHRGADAPQPFENDVFAGLRVALNDAADTTLLAGTTSDVGDGSTVLALEASRRIGDGWKLSIEARAWTGIDRGDPMWPLRRDDYIQLTLSCFL